MITETSYSGHSARVQMHLLVKGSSLVIRQMGPDFVFVEPSSDLPPGEATIVLNVDGRERRWRVKLPEGISKDSDRVALALSE